MEQGNSSYSRNGKQTFANAEIYYLIQSHIMPMVVTTPVLRRTSRKDYPQSSGNLIFSCDNFC